MGKAPFWTKAQSLVLLNQSEHRMQNETSVILQISNSLLLLTMLNLLYQITMYEKYFPLIALLFSSNKSTILYRIVLTISLYGLIELAISIYVYQPFSETEFSLKHETKTQVKNYSLTTMSKDIINNEELKCEYTSEKHKEIQKTLEERIVNMRASNCKSYMISFFDVVYPEGINPRKK